MGALVDDEALLGINLLMGTGSSGEKVIENDTRDSRRLHHGRCGITWVRPLGRPKDACALLVRCYILRRIHLLCKSPPPRDVQLFVEKT